jgi:penicillin-binding protein 2
MESRYRLRIYLLTALVLLGFGVLLSRLYEFQIEKKEFYSRQVPGNRQITVREPGIRGTIKDRNGLELARNKRQYEVSFNLTEIHDAYRLQRDKDPTLPVVKDDGGIPREDEMTDIVEIVKERVIQPLSDLGLARDFRAKAMRVHYVTHGGLVPFVYAKDLTYDEFARLAEHSLDIPGVYLNVRPLREYPYRALSSHTLGYLRQWAPGDIPEEARRLYGYQYVGEDKGIAGVEATLDEALRGPEGWKQVVKSEKGKILGEILVDAVDPGVGAEVTLSIDAGIQYLLSNILRRAGTASGVVMDVETGEILAMASVPDYNPNDFIPSITEAKLAEYKAAEINPLINRCISPFIPGSTFKIPTALVGTTKGLATRPFHCSGYVTYGTYKPRCWIAKKGGSHGTLSLPQAIQRSCNPYFMQLGNAIGTKGMADGFRMLGFGIPTGVPLPSEHPGLVTGSREWQAQRPDVSVTPADIGQFAMGQGNALATPLQLCAVTACVANGGKYYRPRLVKRAVARDGRVLIEDKPELKVDLLKEGAKASDIELIRKGMWLAVNDRSGTGYRARMKDYEFAGKTGTAQVSIKRDLHNSWLLAFGPFEKPKYAVCLLVENGKSGGAVCGPLANLLFHGLKARDEGKRLPVHPLDPAVGNMDPIEAITLPEDITGVIDLEGVEDGETGDEASDPSRPMQAQPEIEAVLPAPTITPEADAEGTVVKPRRDPTRIR